MYQLSPTTNPNYRSYSDRVKAMYRQPATQVSTALILTFITIAFFGFAAIKPTLATVSKLTAELEQKREFDQKITQKLIALQEIQDQYLNNEQKLQVFHQAIPSQHDLNHLILVIEYLAHTKNITLTSLSISPVNLYGTDLYSDQPLKSDFNNQYSEISIKVSADSTIENLQNFLTTLSHLTRISFIKSINITKSKNKNNLDNIFTLSTTINFFWSDNQISPQLTK